MFQNVFDAVFWLGDIKGKAGQRQALVKFVMDRKTECVCFRIDERDLFATVLLPVREQLVHIVLVNAVLSVIAISVNALPLGVEDKSLIASFQTDIRFHIKKALLHKNP